MREARANLDAADVKLTAARDALPSVPTRVPRDRLLDFAINLRDAIGGRTSQASSVEEVNRRPVESFESFAIWDDRLPHQPDFEADPTLPTLAGDAGVQPAASRSSRHFGTRSPRRCSAASVVGWRAAAGPPLEWIEAVRDSADS